MKTLRRLPALAALLIYAVLISGLQMATAGASAPSMHASHVQGSGKIPAGPAHHHGNDLCCCVAVCTGATVASTPEPLPPHCDLSGTIRLAGRLDTGAPRQALVAETPPVRGPPAAA